MIMLAVLVSATSLSCASNSVSDETPTHTPTSPSASPAASPTETRTPVPQPSSAAPSSSDSQHAPAAYELWINNATPLTLVVRVNGVDVRSVDAMVQTSLDTTLLPNLPWSVDVLAANGRQIMSLDVPAGSVWATSLPSGGDVSHGAGHFVDLSCGRIDVWVGPPLDGPMPPPLVPTCGPYESP
jgi:hypothetical protein